MNLNDFPDATVVVFHDDEIAAAGRIGIWRNHRAKLGDRGNDSGAGWICFKRSESLSFRRSGRDVRRSMARIVGDVRIFETERSDRGDLRDVLA